MFDIRCRRIYINAIHIWRVMLLLLNQHVIRSAISHIDIDVATGASHISCVRASRGSRCHLLIYCVPHPQTARDQPRAMSLFENIKADLIGVDQFVRMQTAAGHDSCSILEQHMKAAEHRIGNLKLAITTAQASQLTSVIVDGPWTADQKKRLAAVVSDLLGSVAGKTKARRRMQSCVHFENYLSEAEWVSLRSEAMRVHKIQQLAARAHSVGILCPTETTTFRITCILSKCDNIAGTEAMETAHADLKKAIKSMDAKRTYPHTYLEEFPRFPRELPIEMFNYAYMDGAPVDTNIAELDAMSSDGVRSRKDPLHKELAALYKRHGIQHAKGFTRQGSLDIEYLQPMQRGALPLEESTPPRSLSNRVQFRDLGASPLAFKPLQGLPALTAPEPAPAVVEAGPPVDAGAADEDADAMTAVQQMEQRLLAQRSKPAAKSVAKRPAAVGAGIRPDAVLKRPSGLLLGCGKCRGIPTGCIKCRDPNFKGKRYQR